MRRPPPPTIIIFVIAPPNIDIRPPPRARALICPSPEFFRDGHYDARVRAQVIAKPGAESPRLVGGSCSKAVVEKSRLLGIYLE